MADTNVGDITARLRIDTTEWERALFRAQQQSQQFAQQARQTQQQLSALPFTAIENATNQFARAIQNAGNNQARYRQAIADAELAMKQFGVTTNAAGQAVDRFGQQISGTSQTALRQLSTGIREAQAELNTLQRFGIDAAQSAGGTGLLGHMLGVAGGLGIATTVEGVVRGIVNSFQEITKAIVETGVKMESLRLSFAGAFGGQAQGREAFRQTIELSQRLGSNLETLAESYRRFENAIRGSVLEGDRGRQIFENLATAARGLGLNTHETGQFMNAATQMIQRGTISMEELRRQMGNVAPAIQVASRALGVTTEQLEKMITTGKTQAIPFVEALARQFAQEFGPAAEGAARSAAAAFERLRTELTLLKEAFAQSGLLEFLANVTKGMKDVLQTMRELRDERERAAGGPPVAIPPELAESPAVQRRQAEIEQLRRALTPTVEFGDMPDISRPLGALGLTADQARARIRALEEEQRKAAAGFQRMIDEELASQQRMVTTDPRKTAAENLMKILREGQERLRDIDVRSQIEPGLDVINEKLKVTEKTLQDVRKAFDALGAGVQQPTQRGFAPSQFDPLLGRIATELGIDPNVARALMEQESGGRPGEVSRAGAIGLMQVMPGTGRQMGYTREELFDPEKNIRAGLTYLAQMIEKAGGDISKALTMYNAGPGRGGVPLPTGENATFARDVLGRIPTDPLGIVGQAQRQRDALKDTLDDDKRMASEAAADIADMRRRLQAEERENEREERARRQEAIKDLDIFGLLLSPEQETELKRQMQEQRQRIQQAAKDLDIFGLELSPEQEQRRRTALDFQRRLDEQLQRQQATREEHPEVRLRQEAERGGLVLSTEQEAQLRRLTTLREEQERLHEVLRLFNELGDAVGNAWSSALTSIADGTRTVSQAFQAMAKSILQSMAQIASQQAFRALIQLGAGLLTGVVGGSAGTAVALEPAGAVGAGINPRLFQGGGVITKPTLAMMGEGPSYTKPEYILNRQQMQGLMSSIGRGGGAGGQANGGNNIAIINVANQDQAEREAAAQRALGREVVINHVLSDISRGSGSQIGRLLRVSQQ